MSRAPQMFAVPAGTRPAECRGGSCRAVIYWIVTASGSRMPIDCDGDGLVEPTEATDGLGIAHHAVCPDVAEFRRKRSR